MKKEGDGRVWGRAQGFRKVLDKSPGVQKGAKKGPQTFPEFRILKILRFSKLLCASVDVGVFIAYLWRQKM